MYCRNVALRALCRRQNDDARVALFFFWIRQILNAIEFNCISIVRDYHNLSYELLLHIMEMQ